MTKSFIALAIIAVFLGVSWGGAFIGGIVYGEYRSDGGEPQATPRAPGGGQFAQAGRSGDGSGGAVGSAGQSRQGGSGGGQSNGVFTTREGRTGGPGVQSSGGEVGETAIRPGMGRGGILAGMVQGVEEGSVLIGTESGTVSAALSEETVVVTLREAGVDDLSEGARVVALGRRASEGLTARALLLNPDGVDVSFLEGRPSGGREDRGLREP